MQQLSLDPLPCGLGDPNKIPVSINSFQIDVPHGLNGEVKLSYLPQRRQRGRRPDSGAGLH